MNHPPRWLERLVGALLPPASREPVLGDLSERYRSPGRYVGEALQALAGVIVSQGRRSVVWPLAFVIGIYLYRQLDARHIGALAAALPMLAAVLTLILRGIYRAPLRSCSEWSQKAVTRQAALDAAAVTAAVLVSQGALTVLAPLWMLPPQALAVSLLMVAAFVLLGYLMDPAMQGVWPPWTVSRRLSVQELLTEARLFDTLSSRAMRVDRTTGAVFGTLCLCVLVLFVFFRPGDLRTLLGAALLAASALVNTALLKQQLRQISPLPQATSFAACLILYRRRLVQRQRFQRSAAWRGLPLLLGCLFFGFGPGPADPWQALLRTLPMLAWVVWESQVAAGRLQRRLDQLATVSEDDVSDGWIRLV